jgi:hypothetical protein
MSKTFFNIIGLILFSTLVFTSCDDNDDKVVEISKDGSIETVMSVDHYNDSIDIIKTAHKIWVKNNLVKDIVHLDTVPSLGVTNTNAENNDGDTKRVEVKKDYEIFITVK